MALPLGKIVQHDIGDWEDGFMGDVDFYARGNVMLDATDDHNLGAEANDHFMDVNEPAKAFRHHHRGKSGSLPDP